MVRPTWVPELVFFWVQEFVVADLVEDFTDGSLGRNAKDRELVPG